MASAEVEFNQIKQRSNEQLWAEVVSLRSQVSKLTREKSFLEKSLDTLNVLDDAVQQQLLDSQDQLEVIVAERTRELEENNRLLQQEIKERQRVEIELRQAKDSAEHAKRAAEMANRAKTAFLAKMSHELRTPLNAIIGYSDLLQMEAADAGYTSIISDLSNIQIAGQQLLNIISDILDIAKIEAEKVDFQLTEIDICELVKDTVTIIKPVLQDNQLLVQCQAEVGKMQGDMLKIQQILQNILHNAGKFTHQGTITFNIKREPTLVVFEIIDTGIGIAPEHLCSIFEPFTQADNSFTRQYNGSGLGLTIAHQLTELMGGVILIDSELGKGSTFSVNLPLIPPPTFMEGS